MNLLADENVDCQVVDRLRGVGHAVEYVAEMAPGIPDEDVLSKAMELECVLLTADKDFGELVYRQGRASHGVLLLRLPGITPAERAGLVAKVIGDHQKELIGAFCVLTRNTLRIRRR